MKPIKDKLQKISKRKTNRKLPQDYRKISAGRRQAVEFSLRFLGCAILLTVFLINIVGAYKYKPQQEMYKLTADKFLVANDFQTAAYFNRAGLYLFPTSLSLLQQEDIIYRKINEVKFTRNNIAIWNKIADRYPNYRDAWAQLALSNMKLGNNQEVKESVERIKIINPNWKYLSTISKAAEY